MVETHQDAYNPIRRMSSKRLNSFFEIAWDFLRLVKNWYVTNNIKIKLHTRDPKTIKLFNKKSAIIQGVI